MVAAPALASSSIGAERFSIADCLTSNVGNIEIKELIIELIRQNEALKKEVRELSSAKTTSSVIRGISGLAKFLKMSKSKAQALKNKGIVPYYQNGRVVLFEPEKVLRAIEAQTPKYNR